MSVGGENRVGRIGPGAIRRYHGMGDPALEAALTDAGLSEKFCFATMMDLAYEVPICMEEVMDEYADLPGMADVDASLLVFCRPRLRKLPAHPRPHQGGYGLGVRNLPFPKRREEAPVAKARVPPLIMSFAIHQHVARTAASATFTQRGA